MYAWHHHLNVYVSPFDRQQIWRLDGQILRRCRPKAHTPLARPFPHIESNFRVGIGLVFASAEPAGLCTLLGLDGFTSGNISLLRQDCSPKRTKRVHSRVDAQARALASDGDLHIPQLVPSVYKAAPVPYSRHRLLP